MCLYHGAKHWLCPAGLRTPTPTFMALRCLNCYCGRHILCVRTLPGRPLLCKVNEHETVSSLAFTYHYREVSTVAPFDLGVGLFHPTYFLHRQSDSVTLALRLAGRLGRASEPAFMEMNLHAVRSKSLPKVVLYQYDTSIRTNTFFFGSLLLPAT